MEEPRIGDVLPADPALRRRTLLVLASVFVVCLIALVCAPRSFNSLVLFVQETPQVRASAVCVMLLFAAPFTLLALLGAGDAIRRSVRTLRTAQFPPPGTRVVRDTPIVRGRPAGVIGAVGLALGSTLLAAGLTLPWMAFRIGHVLQYGCPRAAVPAAR